MFHIWFTFDPYLVIPSFVWEPKVGPISGKVPLELVRPILAQQKAIGLGDIDDYYFDALVHSGVVGSADNDVV